MELAIEPTQTTEEPQAQSLFAFEAASASSAEGNPIADEPQPEIRPDVAFNSVDQRYLVTWIDEGATNQIKGRLLDLNGSPLGASFTIAARSVGAIAEPELAYSSASNSYLVVWAEPNGLVSVESYCLGNCITYTLDRYNLYMMPLAANGTPLAASPILLTDRVLKFGYRESMYDIAYNSRQDEFLVDWIQPRGDILSTPGGYIAHPSRVVAQRLGPDGGLRGAQTTLVIAVVESNQIAYSPTSDEYLVLFNRYLGSSQDYDEFYQRFRGDTLAAKGSLVNITNTAGGQNFGGAAYDPNKDRYLVVWWDHRQAQADVRGRLVQGGTGSLLGSTTVVIDSTDGAIAFQPYVGYSSVEGQYMVVAGTSYGGIRGRNVSDEGVVASSPFTIASGGLPGGIAARVGGDANAPRWMVVWGSEFPTYDIFSQAFPLPSTVAISITDSQGNPIPNNALALNSIGRVDPITVTLTTNNTSGNVETVSFNLGSATGTAQFTVTPDVSSEGCNVSTSTLTMFAALCNVSPGTATLRWQVQFHPSGVDPAVTISGQIGSQTTSATLSVPKADRPDAPDAGNSGPYYVGSAEYKFPGSADLDIDPTGTIETELWAKVWWPQDLFGAMPDEALPLLVFMHGAHETCHLWWFGTDILDTTYAYTGDCNSLFGPIRFSVISNHEGFSYLAEKLASWGYIVVSINTNRGILQKDQECVNCPFTLPNDQQYNAARGRLLLKHLQLWHEWNTTGATPAGFGQEITGFDSAQFQGNIDFGNVGLMGHSRGGTGVRAAYYLYQHDWAVTPSWSERIPGLAIKGIFEIGPSDDPIYDPVDANITYRLNADGAVWNVLLPVCDGDIYDWQGLRPFDRMVLNDAQTPAAEKSKYAVWGANHNFYNTEWVQNDGDCVGSRSNIALSSGEQQKTAVDSLLAFFRGNVYSPVINDPLVGSDEPAYNPDYNRQFNPLFDLSPDSLSRNLFSAYQFDRAFTHSPNAVTLTIEDFGQPTGIYTSNVSVAYGPVPEHDPGLQAAAIGWNTASANTFFKVNLPQPVDARAYRSLDISVSRQKDVRNRESPTSEYFSDIPTNLSVSIIYLDGAVEKTSSPVQLTTYTELLGPVGFEGVINGQHVKEYHFILQTARTPLADFANVDLSQVKGVQFTFDDTTQGAIYLTNIQLASQP